MMKYTKYQIAETHLLTAIALFFENAPIVSVYHLAAAAREILTTLIHHLGKQSIVDLSAKANSISLKEAIAKAHFFAGKIKHANTDPDSIIELPDDAVDGVLFFACTDFLSLAKDKNAAPLAIQMYQVWFFAMNVEKIESVSELRRPVTTVFPDFPVSRTEAKARWPEALDFARRSLIFGFHTPK